MRANGGALALERPRENMLFLKEVFDDGDFRYTEEDFRDAEQWFKRQDAGEKNRRAKPEIRHEKRSVSDSVYSASEKAEEPIAASTANEEVSPIEKIEEAEVVTEIPTNLVRFSPEKKDIELSFADYRLERDMLSRWLVPGEDNPVPGRYSLTIQSPRSITTITRETKLNSLFGGFTGTMSPIYSAEEYIDQLERLLVFMSSADKEKTVKKYRDMLAASGNPFEMMEALGTPQMLAAKFASDYEKTHPEPEKKEEKVFRSVAASYHPDTGEEKKETLLTMVVDMEEEEEEEEEKQPSFATSEKKLENPVKSKKVEAINPTEKEEISSGSAFMCVLGICVCFLGIITLSVIELGGVLVLIKTFINLSSSMSYIDCIFTIGLFVVALSLGAFIIVCLLSCIRGLTKKIKAK